MRLVRLLVPSDGLDTVTGVLDEEGVDYVVTEERSREGAEIVEFPIPVGAVESILDALRDAGVDDGTYTVITRGETANTEGFDELEERYVEGDESDDSVAHEEVRAKAQSLLPDRRSYYVMTVLSAIVATAGLLLDSPAVVIGAMAISPQVGAAITGSVGTVVDDREMVGSGLLSLVLGLLVAVLTATAMGWLLQAGGFFPPALAVRTVEQIGSRVSPGVLSLLLGLCAGSAAGFGVATDLPLSLVGVAIAAAVVPAAAAVGIGIVWALPTVALGAATLLVVNTISIVLSATATLWYLGYRPDDWTPGALRANLERRSTTIIVLTVVALLVFFALPSVAMVQHVRLENSANGAVQDTLEQEEYEELMLRSVQAEFTGLGLLGGPRQIDVVVSRPVDRGYPDLAADIGRSLEERTGTDVAVSVEFAERTEFPSGSGTAS
ncbi:TIGR00341 family protein [Salinirubellus sp. GCM10025818]|uniref:TIGR00341 family protein n=1 Tax=Salinirubellus TaxID=2162630 RepID=UPI0030D474A8